MFDVMDSRRDQLEETHADRVLGPEPPNPIQNRAKALIDRLERFDKAEPVLSNNYLVKGWLERGKGSVLYGASNVGKSFIALDMSMHVAAGHDWLGQRVLQGPVVYIAAEGSSGLKNRIAALQQENSDFEGVPLYLLPEPLNLSDKIDAEALAKAVVHIKPVLIVIDTLARSMGDGNENATQDMNAVVGAVSAIQKRAKAHVILVHHSGKNEELGARGSSSLRGAIDTEISVTLVSDSVQETIEIKATKQRDLETPRPKYVSLKVVELGRDQDGDPVTSCVVGIADPVPRRKALDGKHQEAMHALDEALRSHGSKYPGSAKFPSSASVVSVKLWKEQLTSRGLLQTDDTGTFTSTGRSNFQRIKDWLVANNLIRMKDNHVWRCCDE